MSNGVPLEAHSRNSSSVLDAKHFSSKVQSRKSRNNIKPVEKRPNVNKPERWISKGYRLSPDKSFAVRKKPNTPGSCLRWKSTGRIFKTASLRWISTGKMFTDSPTKVDSEPPNGSNDDIPNPYKCDQTLNVSAGTPYLSACTSFNPKKKNQSLVVEKTDILETRVQGIQISDQ
ncbi:hypothetical protein Tco_0614554 [Tanacetum coccineum]